MAFNHLNFWAILAATLAAFMLGGFWYSPVLFGAVWKKANGLEGTESGKSQYGPDLRDCVCLYAADGAQPGDVPE